MRDAMTSGPPAPLHLDNDTSPQPADRIWGRAVCRSIGNRIRHELNAGKTDMTIIFPHLIHYPPNYTSLFAIQ